MNAFKQKFVSGKINLAEVGASAGGAILGTAIGKAIFKVAGAAKTTEVGKKLAGSISKIKDKLSSKVKSIADKLPINKAKELVFGEGGYIDPGKMVKNIKNGLQKIAGNEGAAGAKYLTNIEGKVTATTKVNLPEWGNTRMYEAVI
ncbi:MAG: hypothetical protein ABRQ27_15530 [Clostridiaceae bacterium]